MRNNPLGYLTFSMVDSYIHCPRQFKYEYVDGYSRKVTNANLAFGSVMHEIIAQGLCERRKDAFLALFLERWEKVGELDYSSNQSYDGLKATGIGLAKKLGELKDDLPKVKALEKAYKTLLPDGTDFRGTVDVEFEDSMLDWKTSGSLFMAFRPDLDDQLTAYSMLSGIKNVGYGVLLKRKNPEINILLSQRTEEQWDDFQLKVMKCAADIKGGFFHKNPSQMQCNFCSYTSLCLGDRKKSKEQLKQAEVKDRYAQAAVENVVMP